MNSYMNLSFKSYIDIFNFISKVFAMNILDKDSALYRYEAPMSHFKEWPFGEKFTLCKRYVMKINNTLDTNLKDHDDVVINIVTFKDTQEFCPAPKVICSKPLFSDKAININILVETRFFKDSTFGEDSKAIIPDRMTYMKDILDRVAKIFVTEQTDEVKAIISDINRILAYSVFTDHLQDKACRDTSDRLLNQACAQGLDYIYINNHEGAYEIISEYTDMRPGDKLVGLSYDND